MYGEEQDLCRRARAQGLARPRMTPEATIIHYHGASSRRAAREVMKFKAKATMIRRHFPAWQRPLGLALLGLWPWSRMAGGALLARLTGRSGAGEAAKVWGEVWAARHEWRPGYPEAARGEAE
jgi:GT2 family glycosyltransferase